MPKFVLAYSGGLDTSVILKWLQIHHDADVVTLTADLGQKRELVGVKEKALLCGASAVYVEDLRHEFVEEYVWPTLKAGALYQEVYPLGSAIGRPLNSPSCFAFSQSLSSCFQSVTHWPKNISSL